MAHPSGTALSSAQSLARVGLQLLVGWQVP